MAERLDLHPTTPQPRILRAVADCLSDGGVIVYPTDSCYALGCAIGAKDAMERIQRIRQTDKRHFFTVICRDLSEIARFARVDNWQYRLLRAFTPGPYTFVLGATREVPRRLLDGKRKTVGIRVPDTPAVHALLPARAVPLGAGGDARSPAPAPGRKAQDGRHPRAGPSRRARIAGRLARTAD